MKPSASRFASNKTKLAFALNISRTLLYEFMRLPDAPPACADGRWSIPAFRKFITKKRGSVKGSEREQIQIALLKTKLAREEHDLAEARKSSYEKVRGELLNHYTATIQSLRSELYRMRVELCPQFEGKTAREIYQSWGARECIAFNRIADNLEKRIGATVREEDTRPTADVIPFESRIGSNGAKLQGKQGKVFG